MSDYLEREDNLLALADNHGGLGPFNTAAMVIERLSKKKKKGL